MKISYFNEKDEFKDVNDVEMSFDSYLDNIDVNHINEVASKYNVQSLIIIGNGGSINPFLSLYSHFDSKIKVYAVNTEDYDYLHDIISKTKPESSLVVIVSKSGETSTALIDYFVFKKYRKLILTANKNSTLAKLAEKDDMASLPDNIGGRYSRFTETTLIPLAILGYDVEAIVKTAIKSRQLKDEAKKLAWFFYSAEQHGFSDLFVPIYSYKAFNFFNIITQLIHESFGKDGKGLTVFGGLAPETQHHTNQRFFGGRNNACALMIYAKPDKDENISVNAVNDKLKKFDKLSLSQAVYFEYRGTLENAIKKGKMVASVEFDSFSIKDRAEFLMLLNYFAVYSSLYRNVNPFDQPAVEDSKKITTRLIEER